MERPDAALGGVLRRRLPLGLSVVELLEALPPVPGLVALSGQWRVGAGLVAWDPARTAEDPFDLPDLGDDADDADVFGGGWIGVWGYQLGGRLERLPPPPTEPSGPGHRVGYYDRVLRLVDGTWWFEQRTGLFGPEVEAARADAFLAVLEGLAPPTGTTAPYRLGAFTMVPDAAGHRAAVARTLEHIAAGDVFQANVTARLEARFDGSPVDLFCAGVRRLDPAFAALVVGDGTAVVSLSPELFLRRRGRQVVTSPIKGTAALGTDPADLVASAKDRAENVMIVDLMRNDLGRVAAPGTVEVTALNRVERHAVWHLVSDVRARLLDDVDDGALLAATFPPGSVTGAPKVRAMEVIHEVETTAREAYTGAVGYAGSGAGLELNVAIRTFEVAGDRIWLGVGGGIVADSQPADELAECFVKAAPLIEAVGGTFATAPPPRPAPRGAGRRTSGAARTTDDVFDTLLVRDGEPVDLARHLNRLGRSVRELFDADLPTSLPDEMRASARGLRGPHRLRVDVRADRGAVDVSLSTSTLTPGGAVTMQVLTVPGGLGAHKWADREVLDANLGAARDQLVVDLDGTVLEAGRSALLAVVDDEVCAPVLDGRQLPSTGRERVAEALTQAGLPLVPRALHLDDLARASEVMVVNALRGVVPVTAIEGVGSWTPGWVTSWLREVTTSASPSAAPRPGRRSGRAPAGTAPRVLFVDNYDSFVHNLVQHVEACGAATSVVRNDEVGIEELVARRERGELTHVVLSPGPGTPATAGVSAEVVRRLGPSTPVLGVCLGHQVIAEVYGARVVRADRPVHGKPCLVDHDGAGVMGSLPRPVVVGRYHSLVVDPATVPESLEVSARTPSGVVMGLRHRRFPVEGVQWHPESVLTPVAHHVLGQFLSLRAEPSGAGDLRRR